MTRPWGVPLAIAAGLLAAAGTAGLRRRWPAPRLVGLLPLCTLAGIYLCVPETTHLRGLTVVFAGFAAVGLAGAPLDWAALALAGGVLAWAAWFGGQYRPSSLIAGLAALGLLAVEPAAAHLPVRRLASGWPAAVALLVLQTVFAAAVARNAGLRHDLGPAIGIALVWAVALVAAASLFVPRAEP